LDEGRVVHAVQAGIGKLARRLDPVAALPERGQDEFDARRGFEGRQQLAAVQLHAALMTHMQWRMYDAHRSGPGHAAELRMNAIAKLAMALGIEGRRRVPVVAPR